ncbi:carboxylesterase [Aspergillus sclerotiicarbonarius CBS 121057]|uniref:Carboxylesterase n=1 Tax=Aspergillus sclerotiicarbonarius (strain CBS 121057 / IBT 28362) TaxID=1448318 RepID=A0A319EK28_ASPSB|nr:carboxylesterase [Aspergillus sclerotiicarbonarius CBS 121057]
MLLGLLLPALALPSQSLTVQTANGAITGHLSVSHGEVIEFLGILFAQPPIHDLRWEPPQKYQGNHSYLANNFVSDHHHDCPYAHNSLYTYPNETRQFPGIMKAFVASEGNNSQSEDCLTLNIWTRRSNSRALKPVYVHFYGGRYTSGTTNTPFYLGAGLASSQDIIVVTVNYRMNVFGFPGIPTLSTNNLGLLDQRAAVEWLRDNAEAFGGDVNRIVISGQSCGGAMVDYWAYAWPDDPIVAGLISHSGTALSFGGNTADLSAWNWANITVQLGCHTAADVLACMKRQSVSSVLIAAGKLPTSSTGTVGRTLPAFEATIDNVTIFEDYETLTSKGRFARVPYLLGHNDNEAGFYKIAVYMQGRSLTAEQWQAFNDNTFTCPTDYQTAQRVRFGVPAWRFRYFADWNNTRLYPTSGAYHGVDLNMIYGNSELFTDVPASAGQVELTSRMQAAWAAFVIDPTAGLSKVGWPVFDLNNNTLIRLGYENQPDVEFVSPSLYNQACTSSS